MLVRVVIVDISRPLTSIASTVVRAVQSQKIIAIFSEVSHRMFTYIRALSEALHKMSDLQAEKRGNFVVLGCVEGSRVISWSLNVRPPFYFFDPSLNMSCLSGLEQL